MAHDMAMSQTVRVGVCRKLRGCAVGRDEAGRLTPVHAKSLGAYAAKRDGVAIHAGVASGLVQALFHGRRVLKDFAFST